MDGSVTHTATVLNSSPFITLDSSYIVISKIELLEPAQVDLKVQIYPTAKYFFIYSMILHKDMKP